MKTITKLLPAVITAIIILLSSQSGISQQSDFFKKYSQAKLEISKEIASNPELRDDREKSKEYARSQIRELYASKALDIEAWLPDRGERDRFKPITNSASSTTQVDEGDLQALTDLYNQCNGAGWVNNENWLDGDPSTWYGVSLNGEGRVAGLRLPQNNLTGELPSSFSNLTALQDLLLPNNFLEGTLPASWSVWSSIEYFELRNNNFSGNLPESWSDWTSIKRLLLGSNQIEGTLPESWGLMSSLEIIELGHNPINGTIPISWANLSQLQFIMLDWTNLGGELPREWSNLTNLEHIILGGNQFEGTLPVEWANLQNIIQISVFWNNLNGELPNEWSSLNNLEYLNLGGNYFSGLLPAGWSSLTMLRSISIEDNELIGELPASWALFSQLEYLDLSNNLLSGSLPGSWGDLGNILNINLSSNSLEGGIPHEWNSSQFHSVLLGYNELSGEIPLSWTLNENLMYLGISENRFSVLPDFSASNLTDLWVRSNNLDFADLIPNMGILIEDNSRYIPQKAFGEVEYLALPMGQAFSKFFEVAGEGNLYQWHLNWEEVEGATNAELFINSIDLTNQGVYFLHVTNPAVPDLVLESNGVTLEVIVPDAEITQFEFSYTDCGCNLNTIIDPDNSLITVEVPFTLDISNLAPSFIEIPEGAFVSPEVGVPQDWSNGPINYAVTEEGGAGVWTWTIDVQPWACQEKNILGLSFPEDPVASVIVDEGTSMINITAQEGVDLSSILVQFELPCGASLNYSGQTVINTILFDFSSELNQVFNVVAQDGSTQSWEILLTVKNLPIVSFGGGEAQNCSTGITFSSDKNGWLAIVHEDAIENGQPIFNLATEDGRNQLQWEQFGNWAEFFVAWETAEVSLEWIRPGTYYAFAMDQLGNTSVISEETLVLTPCLRVVNDLTELRNTSAIFQFEISGEIVVSYEEHPAGDYAFKYAQDENAGMKIVDRNNILPDSYGLGTGLTGLKGFLEHTGDEFIFIPTELPDQSSTGNVISPVELIYDDYREQCYYNNAYESMLVRIITPIKAFDDYSTGNTTWVLDYLDLATITAIGDYDWFVQKVFNADYIGLEIPTEPTVYQGIRTNVDWWGGKYGLITPRSLADMISVTDPILNVEPRLVVFNEILVGQCEQNQVELINSGIGSLTINSLALIGPDADNFTIENAPAEGASINSWESLFFDIHFCKQVAGEKNVSVVVNYNDNLLYELPVLGSALTINAVPHCTSFEDDGSDRNGWILSNENVFYAHWQSTSGAFSLGMRRAGDKFAESPAFEITGAYPTLQFNEGSIYTGCYDTRQVLISNDFKQSWQVVAEYSASELPEVYLENNPFMKRQISLEAYNGSTIFVKLQSLDDDPNRDAYWLIDDFCIGDESLSFDQEFLEISGTIPGVCSTSHAYIINSGIISTSITSIEITPESSSDYSVSNLPELPYQLSPGETLDIFVGFCPTNEDRQAGVIMVNYGNDQEIECTLSGTTSPIIGMNLIETFNLGLTGEIVPEGWSGTVSWNSSIFVGNADVWFQSPDISLMMYMRNRMVVDGVRAPSSFVSPRILVTGENPVVSWQENSYSEFNYMGTSSSPRKLLVSTNGVDFVEILGYTSDQIPDAFQGDPWRYQSVSLNAYVNQTIWCKWEMESNNDEYIYWGIDNICFQSEPGPEISVVSVKGDFDYSLTNTSKPLDVRIWNASIGDLEVKSIEVVSGMNFTIGAEALQEFSVAGYEPLNPQVYEDYKVPISFRPDTPGEKIEILRITYGPNGEFTKEVEVEGFGVDCIVTDIAHIGENVAPSQNTIYQYTAEFDQYVTVSTCHPGNTTDPYVYSYDTYMELYTECGGEFIVGHDDDEWEICPYNRASSSLSVALKKDESMLIFWPKYFTSVNDEMPFVFTVETTGTQVYPDFEVANPNIFQGRSVSFQDKSAGIIESWLWEFEGGNPATSTQKNPGYIRYNSHGYYNVALTVGNEFTQKTIIRDNAVFVLGMVAPIIPVLQASFTLFGMKSNEGWTFVDLGGQGFDWIIRNDHIGGNHTNQPPLASTTGSTGFLVLPADEYNSPAPNINTYYPINAYAQSPVFDCSALDIVVIKFEQSFRHCCDESASMLLQVSNNGGQSWMDYDVKNDRIASEIHGDPVEIVEMNVTDIAHNQSEVMFRFYWNGSVRDFWMIDDVEVYGYNRCSALQLADPDTYEIFLGYQPTETATIFCPEILSGAEPFSYLWSTGETTSSITVNPTESASYQLIIHDAEGCEISTEFWVEVTDVHCGKKNDKVLLCVNDKNPHTICVSPNAVPAHLAKGAILGDCGDGKPVGFGYEEFDIKVYPNPNTGAFTVQGCLMEDDHSVLVIKNVLGQTVYYEELNLPAGSFIHELKLPDPKPGMYFLSVLNGAELRRQTLVIR